jgi:hypothetical protein
MKWHGEVMHAPRFVDTQFGDLALWVSEFDESELEDQMDDHFDAEARRREWQDAQGRGPYANDVSPPAVDLLRRSRNARRSLDRPCDVHGDHDGADPMKAIRWSQWVAGVAVVFAAMLVGICLAVAGLV